MRCVALAAAALLACEDGGGSAAEDTANEVGDTVVLDAVDSHAAQDTSAPQPIDFLAAGPWAVGYVADWVIYTPSDGSGERALRLAVWYPTSQTTGAAPRYGDLVQATGVVTDAAPARQGQPWPLVVFSHGNGAFAEQSWFFGEFLASHGFVVAAPDHTGNTFLDLGRPIPDAMFHWRPWDIRATLDHLSQLPETHLLEGIMRLDAVAVAGHSFGGYTTMAVSGAEMEVDLLLALCDAGDLPFGACQAIETYESIYRAGFRDGRVSVAIPMAPGATMLFDRNGTWDPEYLLFTGAKDDTTTNEREGDPLWAGLVRDPDSVRVDFATAGHFTFSHACELPFPIGEDDGCGPGFIDPAEAHRTVNAYALAFLLRHLRRDERGAAVLDGRVHMSDDVNLTRGGP